MSRMVVTCPQCSSQVKLAPADIASRERLEACLCGQCGGRFDARAAMASGLSAAVEVPPPSPPAQTPSEPASSPVKDEPVEMSASVAAMEVALSLARHPIHAQPHAATAPAAAAAPTAVMAPPEAPKISPPVTSAAAAPEVAPAPAKPAPPPVAKKEKEKEKEKGKGKEKSSENAAESAKPHRTLPKKIGSYEIVGEINRGGMGIVYKAMDPQLRRAVAIKVLLAGEGATDEDVMRFQREAQSTARLQHPNIVPIYAVGNHEGKPYFVMDFVEGKTAKQIKEEGRMSPRLALLIIEGCAEALHHAHLGGVIHRDVKPANIIVDKKERAQLMDFGLARRVDEDLHITQSGTTMGTPSYMAPEQAEGKLTEVDAQSDVYSAGACLYELLTGVPPFDGATVMAVLRKVLDENPVSPRRLNPRIHRDVETICMKCLEKEKRNRYLTAKHLAEDIRRFNAGEAIHAKPLSAFGAMLRRAQQHKEITVALLIILLSGLGALAYTVHEVRNVAKQKQSEREENLKVALDSAARLLGRAREAVTKLESDPSSEFEANLAAARAVLGDCNTAFRRAEALVPEHPAPKAAFEDLAVLENRMEVLRFIFKARAFLNPKIERPDDPALPPNYAGAEFAAQEAVARDPQNVEAQEILRVARGNRKVSIVVYGAVTEVYALRVLDGQGRHLPIALSDTGALLGFSPIEGRELEPGHYILTFKRAGMPNQQATLLVARDSRDEELKMQVTVNVPDENMVSLMTGNVTMPAIGTVSVPTFSIDRYEYPNKAGFTPVTGVSMLEAMDLCGKQGKKLCSSEQWLRACTGDSEWRYPYGRSYVSSACATGFDIDEQKRPFESGMFPRCRTSHGVYDMSGNVAEWTQAPSQTADTIFGGEWTSSQKIADVTVSCRARSIEKEVDKERLGFRCCKP